jgi:hypothetical protein
MSPAPSDPLHGARVPALSVILPTDTIETIQPVLERLRRQHVADRIEIVLVTPAVESVASATAHDTSFAAVRIVEARSVSPLGAARAAGIRAATAPLVFIGETHSYPQPGWAEALLAAAASGPWSAVAPGVENANPKNVFSWAGFISDYARWGTALPAGEIAEAPIYNALYRRQVLLECGDELRDMLSHGDSLRRFLQARGHRVYFEPAARITHINIDQPFACIREKYLAGILIGAQRARHWPWWRRLAYAGGSAFIPLVLIRRMLPGMRQATRAQRRPTGTFPLIVLLTYAKALGELVGYVGLGSPAHEVAMDLYEIRKLDYLASKRR